MQFIEDGDVADVLSPERARTIVRDAFLALALGRASNPLRAVAAPPGGWFAAMPAYVDVGTQRALGAKVVCVLPGNAERGLPTHRAGVLLVDPADGELVALVAADTITLRRTAAASVVATEALAARPRGVYALLGAGAQGRAHLEAFLAAALPTELRLWSRTREHALALASLAAQRIVVVVAGDAASAVRGADVIVTVTASAAPLFAATDVEPHAHVNAVGACVPTHRELPGVLVRDAAFYADSRAGALREAGDFLLAAAEWNLEASHVRAELGEVLAGEHNVRHDRATIFESLGLGVLDVACAAYAAARLESDARF